MKSFTKHIYSSFMEERKVSRSSYDIPKRSSLATACKIRDAPVDKKRIILQQQN